MTRALVTLDLGNSGLKARRWALPATGRAVAREQAGFAPVELEREFPAWLSAQRGLAVALSSVASDTLTSQVRATCESAGLVLAPALEPGLENATTTPATVGRDRLFAARGAFEIEGRSCIVLDAGTALTVDALDSRGARPRFLGGAIAPGPALLARALHSGTARLPEVDVAPGAPALGRETRAALRAGVVHGFRGAARELALRVAAEAGLEGAPRVLTGGAAAFLLEPPIFETALRHEPELVHIGLACAWLDGGANPRRHGLFG